MIMPQHYMDCIETVFIKIKISLNGKKIYSLTYSFDIIHQNFTLILNQDIHLRKNFYLSSTITQHAIYMNSSFLGV